MRRHHSSNEAACSGTASVADAHVAQVGLVEQRGEPLGVAERERARDAGRRAPAGRARRSTASKTTPSHGLRSRASPDGEREPAAGPQHPVDLAHRPRRVGREHEPLAAQHDVVARVGLVDVLEVQDARARRSSGRARAPRAAAIAVISGATSEKTTSPAGPDERRGGQAEATRPARELEDPVTGGGRREREQARGDARRRVASAYAACSAHAGGDGVPHSMQQSQTSITRLLN